jgi:CHAT domain-containing protein
VTLGAEEGWTFLVRPDAIAIAPVDGGSMRMGALVKRARASMESEVAGPPPAFDAEAARLLFDSIFGRLRPQLADLDSLTVAPTGPLLSIPFGMLLEGPADPAALAGAPWLIRRMAVAHVPAAANFITLRRVAGGSRATRPWFGFGDFRPPTVAQARATFPAATCAQSAALLAALPPLPGARAELEAARRLLGAAPTDELLGPAFTAAAVQRTRLSDYRILHFATHALLPTDLACQNEPAIVTSDPAGARDADGALLTASAVARMQLDAEAVILSACNTGGPAGGAAGESLSGLARSFFFAGARSLLITHWSVSDQFTAYLVALTLEAARAHPERGLGAALRTAQLRILDESSGERGLQAHPFFWAPLALIGDGGGTGARLAAN